MRVLIFALALAATVDWTQSECQEWADRSAVQPARGVTRVVIIGRAGFLHVEGRDGATEIRATGRACAPIEEFLVGMLLKASRAGSTVTIEAIGSRKDASLFASEAKLDFTVTLPAGMEVDVVDTSGDLQISNVGNTRVADTSGDIAIKNINGSVTIDEDRSGAVAVSDIRGDFTIRKKASGSVHYERVAGRVSVPARYRR
jgi:hypothetical protein